MDNKNNLYDVKIHDLFNKVIDSFIDTDIKEFNCLRKGDMAIYFNFVNKKYSMTTSILISKPMLVKALLTNVYKVDTLADKFRSLCLGIQNLQWSSRKNKIITSSRKADRDLKLIFRELAESMELYLDFLVNLPPFDLYAIFHEFSSQIETRPTVINS